MDIGSIIVEKLERMKVGGNNQPTDLPWVPTICKKHYARHSGGFRDKKHSPCPETHSAGEGMPKQHLKG